MPTVLIVDGANVVGATPNGWWNDRAGAASKLYDDLCAAHLEADLIVLVLEGQAKAGVPASKTPGMRVVHAPKDGDSMIVTQARTAHERGDRVTVVTSDRALGANVAPFGDTRPSTWLLGLLR
ncbi:NYN domain-containing protein [Nocardioides sp. Kera G14]|uniref:NYN domain-containing protein n=1 Tax=Nocardioides sp. Kera G14 TaxID=2884264 RepID=UPI001D10E8CC|nr:NYN domain-containing protein [Nocardioides sp. Kera G14]UDY22652.1 NYN domain-containing protein [Nocardioides sp. Kera G14]